MARVAPASIPEFDGVESVQGVEGVEMQPLPAACLEGEGVQEGVQQGEASCFVCLEPCVNVTKCKCKNRHAHPTCLLKWLETKKCTHCDVCLEQYSNVHMRMRTHTYMRPSGPCWGIALGCSCSLSMAMMGSCQLSYFLGEDNWLGLGNLSLGLGILMIGMSLIGLVLCAVCTIRCRHEGCHLRTTRHSVQVVMSVDCVRAFV